MLCVVETCALLGVDAYGVKAEVNVANGLPRFLIVGLPDLAVQESRERVRTAIKNSGFVFPSDKVITVNLAPADTRKGGPAFDLPIAVGVLGATGQVMEQNIAGTLFAGELGLDGTIRPVAGILPFALWAKTNGYRRIVVPMANTREAAIVGDVDVYGVHTLADVLLLLCDLDSHSPIRDDPAAVLADAQHGHWAIDLADVKGQAHAKRALEVAAAGGHNLLMIGSPGSGKTMLAQRLPTILPPLSVPEALEATKIYSVAGRLPPNTSLITQRPFRPTHHTTSIAGLIGGGSHAGPGEVSLAHHGVLFLDELPEFDRRTLEVMRQPLEDGRVTITRAKASLTYPARFMLLGAMNPCPCGYFGDSLKACTCGSRAVHAYLQRISGPLLDRIDIHIEVPRLKQSELTAPPAGESSAAIRARVVAARERQAERFAATATFCNAQMSAKQIQEFCSVEDAAMTLLNAAINQLNLSARAYDRILKLARTIADLSAEERISVKHVAEAVQYRSLDRKLWGG